MESYLPSRAFSLWLCEFWIPLSWPSSSGRAESSLSPSSAWSLLVQRLCRSWEMPSPGRSAQPPRWALNQWDTLSRWQCCLLWTWIWVAVVVGCCFAFGISVWTEGTCSAGFTCGVRVSSFHGHPWWSWSDPNWRAQFAELVWKSVFSSQFLFSWDIRAAPCHDMTAGLLVLMGRWEEFMARSKREGDTVTVTAAWSSSACTGNLTFPVCSSQWNSRKSYYKLFLQNKHSVEHSFLCSFGIWILGVCI